MFVYSFTGGKFREEACIVISALRSRLFNILDGLQTRNTVATESVCELVINVPVNLNDLIDPDVSIPV